MLAAARCFLRLAPAARRSVLHLVDAFLCARGFGRLAELVAAVGLGAFAQNGQTNWELLQNLLDALENAFVGRE